MSSPSPDLPLAAIEILRRREIFGLEATVRRENRIDPACKRLQSYPQLKPSRRRTRPEQRTMPIVFAFLPQPPLPPPPPPPPCPMNPVVPLPSEWSGSAASWHRLHRSCYIAAVGRVPRRRRAPVRGAGHDALFQLATPPLHKAPSCGAAGGGPCRRSGVVALRGQRSGTLRPAAPGDCSSIDYNFKISLPASRKAPTPKGCVSVAPAAAGLSPVFCTYPTRPLASTFLTSPAHAL
jgi:hypothetical protein